ncbi:cation:proton antiporter [Actinoplanes sp. NPDC026619]|uniref:cation:proton antiporter domain-containing protein n=1 Tax=Actinoplanes sp. NPDC026619 TaxID=3155798 RepID=UPI0033E303E2
MRSSLELVVAVGITILVCNGAARRLRAAPPVPLLLAGLLLGFLPALRAVHLPPEAILLLFLPVLLFWEGFTSSMRQIRRDLRVIVLMSTVLVVLTAAGAAVTAHALGAARRPAPRRDGLRRLPGRGVDGGSPVRAGQLSRP